MAIMDTHINLTGTKPPGTNLSGASLPDTQLTGTNREVG